MTIKYRIREPEDGKFVASIEGEGGKDSMTFASREKAQAAIDHATENSLTSWASMVKKPKKSKE